MIPSILVEVTYGMLEDPMIRGGRDKLCALVNRMAFVLEVLISKPTDAHQVVMKLVCLCPLS